MSMFSLIAAGGMIWWLQATLKVFKVHDLKFIINCKGAKAAKIKGADADKESLEEKKLNH